MSMQTDLTVAAIIERDGLFLMVEEYAAGELVINQPAGHIDAGETPEQAVVRETLEETAWHITAEHILGAYLWHLEDESKRFLRIAFVATCQRHEPKLELDTGIVRALWMSPTEIRAEQHRLRTPMVLRCIDDYLRGQHPAISMPRLNALHDNVDSVLAAAQQV